MAERLGSPRWKARASAGRGALAGGWKERPSRGGAGRSRRSPRVALPFALLFACAPPAAPTAVLSAPDTAPVGRVVELDGSGSTVPAGRTPAYAWSLSALPAGSRAKLSGTDAAMETFVPDVAGDYGVSLTVAAVSPGGAEGPPSAPARKTLHVACGLALPSAALAATPSSPSVGEPVALTAKVADPDEGAPCGLALTYAYAWSFTSLPPGSSASFDRTTSPEANFTPDVAGAYGIGLTVTASDGRRSTTTFEVTAGVCGSQAPSVSTPTIAPAAPQTGVPVTISARVDDPDDDPPCSLGLSLSYSWTLVSVPAGSRARLSLPDGEKTGLTPDLPGEYSVALAVTAPDGKSGRAAVTFTAGSCGANPPSVSSVSATPAAPVQGQTVELSAQVTDADIEPCGLPRALGYGWTLTALPAGSRAALVGPASENPWFVADLPGDYGVSLSVQDDLGRRAPPVSGTVHVSACPAPRVEIAAPDGGVPLGLPVELSATAPASPCAGGAESFAWSFTSLPPGSHASLSDPSAQNPSFTPDVAGPYAVRLAVTDGLSRTGVATAVVTGGPCGSLPLALTPHGPPAAVPVGAAAGLSATLSDPNAGCGLEEDERWRWSFTSLPRGSAASLATPSGITTSFTPDIPGTYGVSLAVTDSSGMSGTASFSVTAGPCGTALPSVAELHATPGSPASIGAPVRLGATVTDANVACGAASGPTYAWSFTSLPAGSHASLDLPSGSSPSFTPDVAGEYDVTLTVTDSLGRSSGPTSPLAITAGACGSHLPALSAPLASPAAPSVGEPVLLSASLDDADDDAPCSLGRTFTFAWTLVRAPPGSRAAILDPAASAPWIVPDLPGEYSAALAVTDSAGRQGAPIVVTFTAGPCGASLPTVTPTASDLAPGIAQAVQLFANPTDANVACGAVTAGFTYAWTILGLPPGSQAALSGAGLASPSFTPDVPGSYVFSVTATDGLGRTSLPAPLSVDATACGSAPPVARITVTDGSGNVLAGPGGSVVASISTCPPIVGLSGLGTTDADAREACGLPETADRLSYQWTELLAPPGSKSVLAGASSATPWMQLDVAGSYVFRMTATDPLGNVSSPPAVATITGGGNGVDQTSKIAAEGGPAALVEVNDIPRVAFIQEATGALVYAEQTGGFFSGTTTWATVTLQSQARSVALAPLGNATGGLALAWVGPPSVFWTAPVYYSECADSSGQQCASAAGWTAPSTIGSVFATLGTPRIALAIRSVTVNHTSLTLEGLAVTDQASLLGGGRLVDYAQCAAGSCASGGFSSLTSIDSNGADDVGDSLGLAINDGARVGLADYDSTAGTLRYEECAYNGRPGSCTSSGWSGAVVLNPDDTTNTSGEAACAPAASDDIGRYLSLTTGFPGVNKQGFRLAFYDRTTRCLGLGACTGEASCGSVGAWVLGAADGPARGRYTSSVTDAKNLTHVAYLDQSGSVARFRIMTVDLTNNSLRGVLDAITRTCDDVNVTGWQNAIGVANDGNGRLANQLATTSDVNAPEWFYSDP